MKTIIAGSRTLDSFNLVVSAVKNSGFKITEVVSGRAKGIDRRGEDYAKDNNIPIKRFPPNWARHGKGAGFIRNGEMVNYAEALIAIWDGKSKGTKNTIILANKKGIPVYIEKVN